METTFGYLNRVHGDLLDAAARERRSGRLGRPSRGRRASPTWLAAAAAVAAVLAGAGVVGWLATGGISTIAGDSGGAAVPAAGPVAGSTGAAGNGVGTGGFATPAPVGFDGSNVDEQAAFPPTRPRVDPARARVIRTAEMTVVIPRDAFDDRFAEAVDTAEQNGGYVQGSQTRERSATLTLRVPAQNFDETLRALRDLGSVRVETLRGRDVTAEYVDLGARLRIAKSRREVLLELMQQAVSIEQTIRVQNALDETQLRIEELQGQLRLLDDRTSLATITLDLREAGIEPEAEVETPSIPNALERSVAGFVGVIAAIVVGIGYLLPLFVLGLVAWLVWTRVRNRHRTG